MAGDVQTEIASAAGPDELGRRGPGALRSLRHRDFALFWSGLIVSSTGSWMQNLAQGWLVYDLTHSKAYLGIVSAAGTLPVLLLTLPSGVIADRFNKRRIVILTQALLTLQALVLATLVYLKLIQPWQIVVLASFSGMVNALDIPTRQAMTVELVGKEDLLNAVALNSSAFNGARIVGPAIAGLIVAAGGPAACFFCNSASYLAVIISLLIIRTRPVKTSDGTESMLAQIREGLTYARRNPLIRDLLILTGIASVFALQYAAVLPALAKDVLRVDPRGLGYMMSAAGFGAFSAAICVAAIGHKYRPGAIVTVGSLVAPAGLVALSMSRSLAVSVGCLVLTGFGMMMFLAVSNSMVQVASPDELRGRMLSVRTFVFMGLAPVGALQIGAVAQQAGVQVSLALGGVACLVAAAYFALFSPAIRRGGRC